MIRDWRKSSYSANAEAQCVEVGTAPGLIGIRDTKNRQQGHLAVRPATWLAFIHSLPTR